MSSSIAVVLADTHGWDGHMGSGGTWWMAIFGTLMMAGFAVLVVWLVRTTAASAGGQSRVDDPFDSARRILAERYASGELSAEEYRERMDHLGS